MPDLEKPVSVPEKLKKPAQPVYTTAQLLESHAAFGVSYAIVAAALKLAGKDFFTFDEAKKLVANFNNRK